MSQNPLVVPDGSGAAVRADINLALDTLNTLNSGAGAPSNPEAYMLWADTGTGYLKQRNAANNAWVALRPLDPRVPLATNSGNAYSITLAPAITAYVGGVVYKFIPNVNSTGAATLNINGLGAISIPGATLTANQPVLLIYDATDNVFVMMGGAGAQGIPHGMQLFTASGTFIPAAGITKVWVIVVGAGAGYDSGPTYADGGYAEGIISVTGNVPVTVGVAQHNAPGGTSSFVGSTTISATGGGVGGGGQGGTGSGGSINQTGQSNVVGPGWIVAGAAHGMGNWGQPINNGVVLVIW